MYDDIKGLAILYAQKKSWLIGEIYNYYDEEIISKYNNISTADETILMQFPWLISLALFVNHLFANQKILILFLFHR